MTKERDVENKATKDNEHATKLPAQANANAEIGDLVRVIPLQGRV